MKILRISLLMFIQVIAFFAHSQQNESSKNSSDIEHKAWLKNKFGEQHQRLIPIVAVADMLFSCNKARQIEPVNYNLKDLILNMDKNRLAEKLLHCLNEDSLQSEAAINYGLLGCFHEQLAHLPEVEHQQKMALVKKAISSLSFDERKKSFTQCVSAQAIHYLQ